jgi:hypothetical protein
MIGLKWARRHGRLAPALGLGVLAAMAAASGGRAQLETAAVKDAPLVYADQGWTQADRDLFYTTSQGSHLMPYAWFKALRRADTGAGFADDQLQRYGYLHNESAAAVDNLPIGFALDKRSATTQLGMTCAACHTTQLTYLDHGTSKTLRIDGAPTGADFQRFLIDLGAAAKATLEDSARFDAFARAVLNGDYSVDTAAELKGEFGGWTSAFQDFMGRALPTAVAWGPGRLDAFGMIFNRVSGPDLDLMDNVVRADAPVSYPFLWNAHRQDKTQWNGVAGNGLYTLGLARNTGEVFGVFADYKPVISLPGVVNPLTGKRIWRVIGFGGNSVDFAGLQQLEEKIAVLKPPPWPKAALPLDARRVAAGAVVFQNNCAKSCHEAGTVSYPPNAWATPIQAVGTDTRMATNAGRTAQSGPFEGSQALVKVLTFDKQATAVDLLTTSVVGALLSEALEHPDRLDTGVLRAVQLDAGAVSSGGLMAAPPASTSSKVVLLSQLSTLYAPTPAAPTASYEARRLYGIWATAPYLHNGSVPTLADLLLPAAQRPKTFRVGTRVFDPAKVGFSTDPEAPGNTSTFDTTLPGNSNAGHDYGTHLSVKDRRNLLEYLKQL